MSQGLRCNDCGTTWTHPTPDRYQAPNCWLCGKPGTPAPTVKLRTNSEPQTVDRIEIYDSSGPDQSTIASRTEIHVRTVGDLVNVLAAFPPETPLDVYHNSSDPASGIYAIDYSLHGGVTLDLGG